MSGLRELASDCVLRVHAPRWRLAAAWCPRTMAEAARRHSAAATGSLRSDLSAIVGASLLVLEPKAHDTRCTVTTLVRGDGGDYHEAFAEAYPALGEVRAYVRPVMPPRDTAVDITTCSRILFEGAKPALSAVAGRGAAAVHDLFARSSAARARVWTDGILTLEPVPVPGQPHSVASEATADALHALPPFDGARATPLQHMLDVWLPLLCLPDELAAARASLRRTLVAYHCRCSKAAFAAQLTLLPRADLLDMAAKGQRELVCHVCARAHVLTDAELNDVIATKQSAAAARQQ